MAPSTPQNVRRLLVLGALLLAASHLRWGIGLLAWVAPVPLLHALRLSAGWRPRLLLAVAIYVGFALATLKIVTAPLHPLFALLFAPADGGAPDRRLPPVGPPAPASR